MYTPQNNEEKAFLQNYKIDDYERPSVTADIVVLTINNEYRLCALLIKRGEYPFKGCLALPGGFVGIKESVDDAARRELREETGIKDLPLVQIGTFGAVDRDPRMRVISVAYMAFVPAGMLDKHKAGDDAAETGIYTVDDNLYKELAFDHGDILKTAVDRLRNRFDYTDDIFNLVRDKEAFTIHEVRCIYEAVKGVEVDPGNFHRLFKSRFITTGFAEETGKYEKKGIYKSMLYRRIEK